MSDDYLWDRSGPPDPEVARLEELLRPLGQQEDTVVRLKPDATYHTYDMRKPDASYETNRTHASRARLSRVLMPLAAAATVVLAVGGWWLIDRARPTTSWE